MLQLGALWRWATRYIPWGGLLQLVGHDIEHIHRMLASQPDPVFGVLVLHPHAVFYRVVSKGCANHAL
jgi:hypothetical protein